MVKVAIAGGSGQVAREIIEALVASGKHEILLLSRKDVSTLENRPNTRWVLADYDDKNQLAEVFGGVDTVLSFITSQTDPGSKAQKNLIDASVEAGVKRFAPSEWATSSFEHMPWYAGKAEVREYLKALNKDKKILEYTLFQPGLFVNYFTHPHKSAKHVNTFQTQFDFENRRAIIVDGSDDATLTLTTAQDLANIVVKAIEHEGEWPVTGGIRGCDITTAELIQLGEEVRGAPFAVERLKADDLTAGAVKSSWVPKVEHAAIPPEQAEALASMFLAGMGMGISVGALHASDEWNKIFPDYKFTQPREFLSKAWEGKA